MANLTDPLIRSIQGTDPQNLMEYITRQKIYDSRFWKEECFGLTTADVLERAARSLQNVGGTFGPIRRPTKFLCLTLKLLQLQPDMDLVRAFLHQDHFKYLRALGALYLRLTGRPQDIYELLEPLYADYSRLKYRDATEWRLVYMDEFVDELLTKSTVCDIALPRLPVRSTLEEAGYLDEPAAPSGSSGALTLLRPTALRDVLEEAGGFKEYLELKMKQELETNGGASVRGDAAALWEKVHGKPKADWKMKMATTILKEDDGQVIGGEDRVRSPSEPDQQDRFRALKRKSQNDIDWPKEEKKAKKGYGTLFKKTPPSKANGLEEGSRDKAVDVNAQLGEGSEEYWNEERAKLGLKPLK